MRVVAFVRAAVVALALATVPAVAEDALPASDMTAFTAACGTAQDFLLGEIDASVDVPKALSALCGCLAGELKDIPQKGIDVLTADLSMTSTEESHVAYGDYDALKQRGGEAMGTCFQKPEVMALLP